MTDDANKLTLADGLKVGETTVHELILRAPTAGDIIDARLDAERAVMTPDGYQLLVSETLMSFEVMRRQVVRIGEDSGPMDMAVLKRLSSRDLAALNARAEAVDELALQEVAKRGRADGAGGDGE